MTNKDGENKNFKTESVTPPVSPQQQQAFLQQAQSSGATQVNGNPAVVSKVTKTTMSLTTNCIEPFDIVKPEKWASYSARFDLYLQANEIEVESRKRAIFLTVCGPQLFDLLVSLASPKEVSDLTLEEIKDTLKNHFSPKPSEIAAFFKFFKRDQLPDELFASYVAELRRLAVDCNFGTSLDKMLCNRLVCGLRDEGLQRNLLAETGLNLTQVINRAQTAEAAIKNLHDIRHPEKVQQISRPHFQQKQQNRPQTTIRPCNGCGASHARSSCPHLDAVCNSCGKTGHIQSVCRSTTKTTPINKRNKHNRNQSKSRVNQILPLVDWKKRTTVTINNKPCGFEVDSGSNYTIISFNTFKSIWPSSHPEISKCELNLMDFQRNPIPIVGIIDIDVSYNGKTIQNLPVVIVGGTRSNVLGCNWFSPLGISLLGVNRVDSNQPVEDVVKKFQHLFGNKLGCYTGPPVSLQIDTTIHPIRLPPRRIPIAIRSQVEDELNRLIEQGILESVEYSDWTTPIVPVQKSDGTIRICGDYKSTLNKALKPHCFQIPAISTLLSQIGGGAIFAKLDLAQAYQQLSVDQQSSMLQTIVTHKGAFRVTKLQFGISSAPGIFQNFIEGLLRGIEGVLPYFDDIVVTARDEIQLAERLTEILSRIDKYGLRLKLTKCKFGVPTINFLGYKIDGLGIRPTTEKVLAITNASPPNDKKQLQAFLGLLNFYHTFLPQKATVAEPLHRLLDQNQKWEWTKIHQQAFDDLKNMVASDQVLIHYNEKLPLLLVCDASPYGLGVVLCHRMTDGAEKPISFYSKTLSKAQRNYSQIDRESVAIVEGVKKFHEFLFGRHFTIVTDHRPLLGLFNPDKQTPKIISTTMLRRIIFLSAYDYNIVHRSGTKMGNADFLSRLPLPAPELTSDENEDVLMIETIAKPVLDAESIAKMTSNNSLYLKVLSWALRGWPEKLPAGEENLKPFFNRRNEISCLRGCLLWGNRTIIPPNGQATILNALHSGHPGIVRMKALARSYVWWPSIDADCEQKVRTCQPCQENQPENEQAAVHYWETTQRPWSRLHIDHAGPFRGKIFFIIVDSFSKWLEVFIVNSTTSRCSIQYLRSLFATHGLPDDIVSDNGTAFSSEEFREFCESNLIRHIRVAPFHPSSNGQAERMVQTAKNFLKKLPNDADVQLKLSQFLMSQHITPSPTTGRSPSELLYNRQVKTYFDKIHPYSIGAQKQIPSKDDKPPRLFHESDRVWCRNYARGPNWIAATIQSATGPLSYRVRLESGQIVKRHVDQLRARAADQLDVNPPLPVATQTETLPTTSPKTRETLEPSQPETETVVLSDDDCEQSSDSTPQAPLRRSARDRKAPQFFHT